MCNNVKRLLTIAIAVALAISGCTGIPESAKTRTIDIAEQYGLAYAPLQIVKELKLIEKNLPGVQVNWKQLGNTAAIREGMLAGEVDAGFMAIPPFLIGWDKGMDWKIFCGLSESPVGLVVNKEEIKSLKDLGEKDRIALPQPGSVQHILLSMGCEREFGDAKRFDSQLVTLAHPDGMNALLSKKDITAHFTAPPYLAKELETPGMHEILSGNQAMGGDFTFIVGVTGAKFHDSDPEAYNALVKSIGEAVDYINNNREEAVELLAKAYGMKEEELAGQLNADGMEYTVTLKGADAFAGFMKRNGFISRAPKDRKEIMWEDVQYEK